jgi:hypothetical protein
MQPVAPFLIGVTVAKKGPVFYLEVRDVLPQMTLFVQRFIKNTPSKSSEVGLMGIN